MKELKIGEIGVIDGVKVQCLLPLRPPIEKRRFGRCWFCAFKLVSRKENTFCHEFYKCAPTDRIDGKYVYFKKVE